MVLKQKKKKEFIDDKKKEVEKKELAKEKRDIQELGKELKQRETEIEELQKHVDNEKQMRIEKEQEVQDEELRLLEIQPLIPTLREEVETLSTKEREFRHSYETAKKHCEDLKRQEAHIKISNENLQQLLIEMKKGINQH